MIKSVLNVSFITLISRVLGYIRDFLLAYKLGTSIFTDIFIASFRFANLFRTLFGEGAFNAAFVPLFSRIIAVHGKKRAIIFAGRVQSFLIISLTLFSVIIIVFMPIFIMVTTPGLKINESINKSADKAIPSQSIISSSLSSPPLSNIALYSISTQLSQLQIKSQSLTHAVLHTTQVARNDINTQYNNSIFELTIELSRITFPYLAMISIAAFYGGILSSIGIYGPFAATSIVLNAIMILSIILAEYARTTAHAMAYGVIVAGFLELAMMIYFIIKNNMIVPIIFPRYNNQIKQIFVRMVPGILSSGITQINIWIDMMIISFTPHGMSYIYFSDRVVQLPLAIIGAATSTVVLSKLASAIEKKDIVLIHTITNHSIYISIFFAIPSAFGLMILSSEIVQCLFMHGAFSKESSFNTSATIFVLSIGLPAFIMNKLFTAMLYANFNTKTPMKIVLIGAVINSVIGLSLVSSILHIGVGIASSVSAWIICVLLGYQLYITKIITIKYEFYIEVLKYIFAAIIMSVWIILYLKPNMLHISYLYALSHDKYEAECIKDTVIANKNLISNNDHRSLAKLPLSTLQNSCIVNINTELYKKHDIVQLIITIISSAIIYIISILIFRTKISKLLISLYKSRNKHCNKYCL